MTNQSAESGDADANASDDHLGVRLRNRVVSMLSFMHPPLDSRSQLKPRDRLVYLAADDIATF